MLYLKTCGNDNIPWEKGSYAECENKLPNKRLRLTRIPLPFIPAGKPNR